MAPPTCPTMAVLKTAPQGPLMCVKYHPWHKCYWQTWLDSWGSELPAHLMHIHLLYPTGLARAPKLCHLATLQLPHKCIVTLIMQICILFSPNTCIRSLLLYWSWDTGLDVEFWFILYIYIWIKSGRIFHIFVFLHFVTVVTWRRIGLQARFDTQADIINLCRIVKKGLMTKAKVLFWACCGHTTTISFGTAWQS